MLTSVPVSAILLILGVVVFIILCFKGMNTGIAAVIAAAIVALGATDGWLTTMFDSFQAGVGTAATNYALMFMASGIFSYVMSETRAGEALAMKLLHKVGNNKAPFIVFGISAIMVAGGIGNYVFIVAPISWALMKAADLPNYVGFIGMSVAAPVIGTCVPGMPSAINIIPTTYLGTSVWAAPGISIIATVFALALSLPYVWWIMRQARQRSEHWVEPSATESYAMMGNTNRESDAEYPHWIIGLVAILLVVCTSALYEKALGLTSNQAVTFALLTGAVFIVLTNFDTCIKKLGLIKILSRGGFDMVNFMVILGFITGFGNVTKASACFNPLQEIIMGIDVNPYVTAWLSVALITGLCASGGAGSTIWLTMFGETFAAMPNVNTSYLHRVIVTTGTTFDSLPHASSVAGAFAAFKVTYKEAYGKYFVTTVLIPLLYSGLVVLLSILFT